MIKIYGSPRSSAARCYWTLEEAGVAYERIPISFSDGEHKAPEFLALNPNGKVPVMVDGDLTMWESIAINRYIAQQHMPALLGSSVADRAHVDQWSVWSQVEFQVPVINLFIQLRFVPEPQRDAAVMDKARGKITPLIAMIDAHLGERTFMVGDTFTLADLNVASVAKLLPHVGVDIAHLPHLSAWLGRTTERPSAQRLLAMGA